MDPHDLDSLEAQLATRAARVERWRHLVVGDRDRWLLAAWTVAVAARLTLGQAQQPSWMVHNLLLVVATAGLWRWGGRLFWAVAAVAFLIPLYGLGDWLTQSVVLLGVAGAGVAWGTDGARDTARSLAVVTYGLAVFHKLNTGFLDPNYSCANDGWAQLASWLHGVTLPISDGLLVALPWLILVTELALLVLLLKAPRGAMVLGALFHVPLTMVLAPSFVFTMGVGYVAALRPRDRAALAHTWRDDRALIIAWTLAGVLLTVGAMGRLVFFTLMVKIVVLLAVAAWAALSIRAAVPSAEAGLADAAPIPPRPLRGGSPTPRRSGAWAIAALFVAHAMTPYLGTQFQHTGAMLSNLRIDDGCWNHVIVPEAIRIEDPYLRFESASLGNSEHDTLGHFEHYEALLTDQLWSPFALRRIRRNWCTERTQPIWVQGTYLGEPIVIADLCTSELPHSRGLLGWGRVTPNVIRFQKHLERTCPQTCLH